MRPAWTPSETPASWGDIDADGHLDLVVATLAREVNPSTLEFEWGHTRVYRNLGDGRFTPADDTLPLVPGSSFIAPLLDLDDDGDLDLLLTQEYHNHVTPQYFRNDGLDENQRVQWTELYGDRMPLPHAVMGAAPFDVDADGRLDLALSNLFNVTPFREALLENQGNATFVDGAPERGAFAMDTQYVPDGTNRLSSWAIVAADVDNDTDEDLYISYGHFSPGTDFHRTPEEFPLMATGQRNALLENDGAGGFSVRGGTCAEDAGQSRAAVAGDIDRDGCLDLVVVNQNGSIRVLRNRCGHSRRALAVRLVGRTSNRDAVGARVEVTVGDATQHKRVFAGSNSLHSAAPKMLHFGLGDAAQADRVEVWWPSGAYQRLGPLPAGTVLIGEPAADQP